MIKQKLFNYKNKTLTYEELPIRDYKYKIEVICDNCGKTFISCKALLKKNNHQLCKQCAIKLHRRKKLNIGERINHFTILEEIDDVYKCKCDCGNIVYKTYRQLSHDCISCGCIQKQKASEILKRVHLTQVGDNHPNWKGGISSENRLIRTSVKYKEFRKQCLERDNYTCQLCNKVGGNLNVHHLYSFNCNKDKVYDIDNGITLCSKCHRQYHHIYGFNNTKEQFEEYKKSLEINLDS